MMRGLAPALVAAAMLFGCAAPPPPPAHKTTVVLMPDEDGNVGAVSVSTAAGSQVIDKAFDAVTNASQSARPSGTNAFGKDPLDASYGALLKAQPPKPKTYVLHFVLDSIALTEESKALIPEVLAAVRERKPTEISVFGHADSSGTEKRNNKLSSDRANVVANLLRKSDPTLDHIEVQYFGDRAPLVHTEGHVPEPRNRRAEILIL
jgi:peptidoglycan-associated lipoprotein